MHDISGVKEYTLWVMWNERRLQPSNIKVWNSKASTWLRAESVRDHFNKTKDMMMYYRQKKIRCGIWFIKNENKHVNSSSL